jgi:hypothetical protein
MASQYFVFIIPGHDDHVTLPVGPQDLVSSVVVALCTAYGLDPRLVSLYVDNVRLSPDARFCVCVSPGQRVIVDEENDSASASSSDEDEADGDSAEEETDDEVPSDAERRIQTLIDVFNDRYPRDMLERALRAARWQPDRAVDMLESGRVPDGPVAFDYRRADLQPPARYTPEQKAALRMLHAEFHLDTSTLLQCFEACDRELGDTRALLAQIRSEG